MNPYTQRPQTPWTAFLLAPLLGVVIALLALLAQGRGAEARPEGGLFWDDDLASYVRRSVAATYVDEIPQGRQAQLYYAALDGYVHSLDEYCDFIPPDEYVKWREQASGHYEGIGVQVKGSPEGLVLLGVFPGGPADKAGLKVGEILTTVEGVKMAGLDPQRDEAVKLLKGPPASPVRVAVVTKPPKDAPPEVKSSSREVTIIRGTIRPPTVFPRRLGVNGKTGYLRLKEFVDQTAEDFDRELNALVKAGVTSVILDLRGNRGGVLPATVRVADRFLNHGAIVKMQGRTPSANRVDVAKAEDDIPDSIALVVLVDGESASASEVLAGAIQDHRRGVLLGTRTYGKFLVQNITETPGHAALKLTTARYTTPLGRWYQRTSKDPSVAEGLLPDIVVEMSAQDREKLAKAQENAEDAVWRHEPSFPEVAADWIDPQLKRALEVIDGNQLLQEIRGGKKDNG